MKVCDSCLDRVHSRCKGDLKNHCGCLACYGDVNRGPFYIPPDGTPHTGALGVTEEDPQPVDEPVEEG